MSTRLVGWALRDVPAAHPELTTGARLLLVYIADHLNEDEGAAWPSQRRLALHMGCDPRSVRRWLDELMEKKIVTRQWRQGTSNMYRIPITPDIKSKGGRTHSPRGVDTQSSHPGHRVRQTYKEPINELPTPIPPKYKPEETKDVIEGEELTKRIKKLQKELRKKR